MKRRPVQIGAVLLMVVALAACDGRWAQFRAGHERWGYNADETKITPTTVTSLQVAWDIELPAAVVGASSSSNRGLVVADGKVIVATVDNRLRALDATSGDEVWAVPAVSVAGVAVAGERVFVSTNDRNLTALDLDTGARLWRVPTLGLPGAPMVDIDIVHVVASDNRLYRYRADTGNTRDLGFPVGAPGVMTMADGSFAIYIRSGTGAPGDPYLVQAHTTSGGLLWSRIVPIPATVVAAEDRAYVGGRAIDGSGEIVWERPDADWYTTLAYADGVLYGQRPFEAGVVAMDPVTGATRWTSQPGFAFPASGEGPVVTDGLVWVSAGARATALDSGTGAVRWASDPSVPVLDHQSPVVAQGRVFAWGAGSFTRLIAWDLP